jgi:hypothetical protein
VAEQRRSQHDAGDDLADDRWLADAAKESAQHPPEQDDGRQCGE